MPGSRDAGGMGSDVFAAATVTGRWGDGARLRRCGAKWTCLVLLLGCAQPRPPLPRPPSAEPQAVLDWVREREARIESLRARFTAETRRDGEHRAASGVLLVRKPDRFRLRLTLPLGLTVFDYLSAAGHVQLALPLEDRIINGPPSGDFALFSHEEIGQVVLRGSLAFAETCVPEQTNAVEIVVRCRDGAGDVRREMRMDSPTATIREETTYDVGQPRLIFRFDDYRVVGDATLPYRIALVYTSRALRVDITVERYEVNPELGDHLFQPLVPWAGS